MDNLRGFLDYVRNFFVGPLDNSRKRRAVDRADTFFSPKKCIKLSSMSRDFEDDLFMRRNARVPVSRYSRFQQPETIVIDDDDDIKRLDSCRGFKPKVDRFTSTPAESRTKPSTNGDDNDDVAFVREIKLQPTRRAELKRSTPSQMKPFSSELLDFTLDKSSLSHNGTSKETNLNGSNLSKNFTSSSLDYSIRLDDKMQYKKLLERAGNNSNANNSSMYQTPTGKLFNYDTSSRTSRILALVGKYGDKKTTEKDTGISKDKLKTKDRIMKVLDGFQTDPVVVRDSDSDGDSDVILLPPSPKPDFVVEPVNSLKKVVDTTQQSKTGWLTQTVENHRRRIEERQKEVEEYSQSAEKHSQINRDIRMGLITSKINKSMSIKDAVLPVEEVKEKTVLPPLTSEQLKMVQRAFSGNPNEVLAKKFNLNITRRDLQTLSGLNWLNDEVINFYMNLIIERGKSADWPKAYAMNTFFYSKLIKDGAQSLRRWTRRIDLFEHDLVCVPIHLGMHWCMAIIDFRDKTIRYYDSMGGSNDKCLNALRNYLEDEHLDKKKTEYDTSEFKLKNVKNIPQQMNGSDCGMFSCTYAEFLSRNAEITFEQEHMPYLRRKMVVEIMTGELLIQ